MSDFSFDSLLVGTYRGKQIQGEGEGVFQGGVTHLVLGKGDVAFQEERESSNTTLKSFLPPFLSLMKFVILSFLTVIAHICTLTFISHKKFLE